jgi:tetratricopeptide (TPR) repeat protein
MKTLKIIILSCLVIGIYSPFSYSQNLSEEESEVMKAINADVESWQNRNYEEWIKGWIHDESAKHIVASKLYHHELEGWEAINSFISKSMKENPDPLSKSIQKNFQFRISGDLAFVSNNIYSASESENEDAIPNKIFRVLIKKDEEWKMAELVYTGPTTYAVDNVEWCLNSDGYTLLQNGMVPEAIMVFKLNTELYPDSGNVWDSLGEGYMVAGKTELAIQNYEKSLEIDPSNTNAEEMLAKLKDK